MAFSFSLVEPCLWLASFFVFVLTLLLSCVLLTLEKEVAVAVRVP